MIGESVQARFARIPTRQLDQLLRRLDRKRPQHDGIQQAEHRRVGTDAERQDGNGNRREHRGAAQRSAAVADVLPDALGHRFPPGVAHAILDRCDTAHFDARLSEQPSESAEEAGHESHHNSPSDASRILAIAVVWSSQSRVSRFSFARPSSRGGVDLSYRMGVPLAATRAGRRYGRDTSALDNRWIYFGRRSLWNSRAG
jgi:hypothetical protein